MSHQLLPFLPCPCPTLPLCQLELKYKQEHVHATASGGVVAKPLLEGSVATGIQGVVLGAEVGYDTATNKTTKYNFGVAFAESDYAASLLL